MASSTRRNRRSRNRPHPYNNEENATQSSQWDMENPENWTGARFRDELRKLGINIPKSWSKALLKQLYLDNKERLCNNEIREGAPVAADDHIRQPTREVLQDPPTDEGSSAPSTTRMDSVTGNDVRDSNVNNMAALFTSTMVNTFTQCMASMQPSVTHIRPSPDSFNKTYDLANWYEQRNASDVPLVPVPGTTQRTTAQHNFNFSPSTSALPFSHHTSAEMDSTRYGVRSDSFTNVDIVSPNIQRNIIEDHPFSQAGPKSRTESMHSSKCIRSNVALSETVSNLWNFSISEGTKVSYETGYNHFLKFLLLNGISVTDSKPYSVSEDLLIYFATHCFQHLKLQYSTIKLYICGIRHRCLKDNICSPFNNSSNNLERLSLFLNSIKRLQKPIIKDRLPITFDILQHLCVKLKEGIFSPFIDQMLYTAFTVAFYGFLHCGEFTIRRSKSFDCNNNLCISDVLFYSDYVILHLKQSKTDPFRMGVDIQLHKLNHDCCPFKALHDYLIVRNTMFKFQNNNALFIDESGKALEREFFISKLKHLLCICGYNPQSFNGHSFRIGAATTAGKSNIEDHLIKTLGRWKSNSYCRYIRTSKNVIKKAQQKLSS
ncbi:uncharacterized protein LOC134688145 [Mytilus trossulus]|uniref:uncharacterized protein LOC134688145 n=1 Tax=Mytilus trossulus TaxID=6551 RepID=UPI003007F141